MKQLKHLACLAGFFTCNMVGVAQEKEGNVWLGINVSTYHFTVQNANYSFMPYFNEKMQQVVPCKVGLDLKVKLNRTFGLSAGLLLDIMTAKNKENTKVSNSNGFPVYETTSEDKIRQTYLEVPVRMDARFSSKKIAPLLTVGAAPRVFLKQKYTYSTNYNGVTSSRSFVDRLQPDGPSDQLGCFFQLGVGVDAMFKNVKLQAFPMYEFSFLSGGHKYGHKIGLVLSASYKL